MPRIHIPSRRFSLQVLFSFIFILFSSITIYADEGKKIINQPIIVNGDTVEYLTENKEVIATGNVFIIYKGTKLTCDKITVNTETKDSKAEGNVRLEDSSGVVEGTMITYNFQDKTGTIIDADFRSNPYFGKAKEMTKVSDAEFIVNHGHMSTCSYDHPHYRIQSEKVNFFTGDKIQTKRNTLYIAGIPVMYLPWFNRSLKDPMMHVQFMPGHSKDWGYYLLSAWRYNLTERINGRIYLDYRDKLGIAEGFGANYNSSPVGRGDFKFYYTHETDKDIPDGDPNKFQRYFVRWRHQWDIAPRTNFTAEYYKIVDSKRALLGSEYNILKDFFPRSIQDARKRNTGIEYSAGVL